MAGKETVEDVEIQDEAIEEVEPEKKTEKIEEEEVPVRGNPDKARQRLAAKDLKKSKAEDDDDEVLSDKAAKLIEKEIERRMAPREAELENRMLLRDYLADHPEHRKYEGKAQKYMVAHPTLTVPDIFKIVAPTVDPEERDEAVEKAKKGNIGGSTVRKGETKVASTEKDFKEVYKNVKRGDTKEALKALGIKN